MVEVMRADRIDAILAGLSDCINSNQVVTMKLIRTLLAQLVHYSPDSALNIMNCLAHAQVDLYFEQISIVHAFDTINKRGEITPRPLTVTLTMVSSKNQRVDVIFDVVENKIAVWADYSFIKDHTLCDETINP